MRLDSMKGPTITTPLRNESEYFRKNYITSGEMRDHYYYIQTGDYTTVAICFDDDLEAFKKNNARLLMDGGVIMEMSEKAARLPSILKYPGMREYFEKNGFATSFIPNDYLMCPVIFNNIYKGALGEFAGSFIIEKETGIALTQIKEPEIFETFDFRLTPDVYIDFKNWSSTFLYSRDEMFRKANEKLEKIGGKRGYIINLINTDDSRTSTRSSGIHMSANGKLCEINGLIDADGRAITESIAALLKEV